VKTYLLVFEGVSGDDLDLKSFVDALDEGAEMMTLDAHVCFLRSGKSLESLTSIFTRFAGDRLFFITDITHSEYSGRMFGVFWQDFIPSRSKTAAE
jgi:hypothetical protein